MNIVQIIDQHTFALKRAIEQVSLIQRKSLVIAIFGFYQRIPHFENIIERHYQIRIDNKQLFKDIELENLSAYQSQIKQANANIDEYAEDYEESEATQMIVLDAFSMMVLNQKDSKKLLALFSGMIELLDYYENFSEDPAFWHQILEQEIIFQEKIMNEISEHIIFDDSIYTKRYQHIEFPDLD